jgi:hypothetical protein
MNNICLGKFKWPLPQGLRGFWGMGVQAGLAARGRKGIAESITDGTKFFFGEIAPEQLTFWVNGFELDNRTGKLKYNPTLAIRGIVPTTVQPAYDIWQNTNFMGGTSYRTEFTNSSQDTKSERTLGKKNVSDAAQEFSDFLWMLGGGDSKDGSRLKKDSPEVVPGVFDVNPSVIETLVRGYSAGTGKFAMDMYSLASQVLDPEKKVDISTMSIANSFWKQPRNSSPLESKMWDIKDKIEFYKTQFNDIKKNNPDRFLKIVSFHTRDNLKLRREAPAVFEKELQKYGTRENQMYDLLINATYFSKLVEVGRIDETKAKQQADIILEQFKELQ